MTDNTPALVQPEQTRELATADVDSWTHVASDVIRLANLIAPTEFVPRAFRDSAPATAAAMLYGREVGFGPLTSLTMLHVIEGKPAMSAEGMRGLIFAAGHELHYDESTGARCVVRGRRYGSERWTVVEWTIDMARQAGLLSKSNWKNYPADMLAARATARLARMVFPDVIHGFRAVEEFDDNLSDEPAEPATPTTKVTRARKTTAAPRSLPAPLEERPARPENFGPPLPGEEGYQSVSTAGAPAPTMDPSARGNGGMTVASRTGTGPAVETQTSAAGEVAPASASQVPAGPPAADPDPGVDEAPGTGEDTADGGEAPDVSSPGEGGGQPHRGGEAVPRPRLMTRAQQRGIEAALTDLGVDTDREERHRVAGVILGREVPSFTGLSIDEAKTLIETFAMVKDRGQLDAILHQYDAARSEQGRDQS